MNTEAKLGLLNYKKGPEPHIAVRDPRVCVDKCADKPCTKVCPALVYEWSGERRKVLVAWENCIECGACRMLCPFDNIACDWPPGGAGVQYQYG